MYTSFWMLKTNFIKSFKEILRAHKLEIMAAAQKTVKRKRKGHACWLTQASLGVSHYWQAATWSGKES